MLGVLHFSAMLGVLHFSDMLGVLNYSARIASMYSFPTKEAVRVVELSVRMNAVVLHFI